MSSSAIAQLTAAIDAVAVEPIDGSLAGDLRELQRLRTRLDAEISRRIAAFDTSGEWALDGAPTAASWLAHQTRMPAAHRDVKVARQVRDMPTVGAAWSTGEISTAHVEVLATARKAARADERFAELEAVFVTVARAGTPQDVVNVLRQWRDALDAERQDEASLAEQQYDARTLHISQVGGRWVLEGEADAEGGSYIDRAIEHEYARPHKEPDERTPAQQRIDALTSICRKYLDGLPVGSNRPHVLLLADLPTLQGDAVGLCETDQGIRVSPETLRRIACDAFIATAAVDATSAVLDLGRATRSFTAAQRRAILAQYPTCVAPGCRVPASDCQPHHIDWWDDDGPTDLGNGVPLCWHDHHLVHEKRWRITRDPRTGAVDWFRPDGTHAGTTGPRTRPTPIPIRDEHRDLAIARALALARITDDLDANIVLAT